MDASRFFLSTQFGFAVIVVCFGLVCVGAGLGYRRAAAVLALAVAAMGPISVAAGLAGAFGGLAVAGRGEGAGVAALLFGVSTGAVAAVLTIAGGITFIVIRRQHYLARVAISRPRAWR